MNNLRVLDLSFNKLKVLKHFQLEGLTSLTSLYLNQDKTMSLREKSFINLTSIRDVYLDLNVVLEEKCFFMHGIDRHVERRVNQGKYVFYKSLNLLVDLINNTNSCDLKFQYLQFKVHFNLKLDQEFEQFFDDCKQNLSIQSNSYANTLSSCGKGNKNGKDESLNEIDSFVTRGLVRVLSNFVYLLTMFALFVYLGPILALVLAHLNST